jgi:hypothetical protein
LEPGKKEKDKKKKTHKVRNGFRKSAYMACDTEERRNPQNGTLGQRNVPRTNDTHASITHPQIPSVNTDIAKFLNKGL